MTFSIIGLGVGIGLIVIYLFLYVVKHSKLPNLGTLLLLFLCGPIAEEAVTMTVIFKKIFYDGEQLNMGIFENNIAIIAFGVVALIYAIIDTVWRSISEIYINTAKA